MENIDISILKEIPSLSERYELIIEPLAPLSMVEEFPGSFYKSLKIPSKKMICGLFENILGWHIDWLDRKSIIIEMEKLRKKQKINFLNQQKGSTYIPLLMEYFEVENEELFDFRKVIFYDDLWSRLYRRSDAVNHAKGTENIDYTIIPMKRLLKRESKNPKKVDNTALDDFFKQNLSKYPMYYTIPTNREYLQIDGIYRIPLLIDKRLANLLNEKLENVNIGYLGNSEGWINVKLERK